MFEFDELAMPPSSTKHNYGESLPGNQVGYNAHLFLARKLMANVRGQFG